MLSSSPGSRSRLVASLAAAAVAVLAGSTEPASAGPTANTTWRPAGALPLPDATAAARVRPAPERRSTNAAENRYRPTERELHAFRHGEADRYGRTAVRFNPLAAYVTGGFSGTTDEILQWVAHKWGIPEDIVRAVAVTESSWRMSQRGDRGWVPNPGSFPLPARVSGSSEVYRSLGIMQVKWTPDGRQHVGTEPLRWKSTAFNADYWGAVVRYNYDGRCDWCGRGYGAGQSWASIGAWFNPSPWGSSATYVAEVRDHAARRPWERAGF